MSFRSTMLSLLLVSLASSVLESSPGLSKKNPRRKKSMMKQLAAVRLQVFSNRALLPVSHVSGANVSLFDYQHKTGLT